MATAPSGKTLDLAAIKVACANCNLHHLCLPLGIDTQDIERLDDIINRKRPLARGEYLFRAGAPFHSIYAIRSGSVKSFTATLDGQEQVTGFHLPGELVGLDAISSDSHNCSARALETTSVCEIPYQELETLSARIPSLQRQLMRVMSREILQDEHMMMLLGRKAADERLAAMLVSISNRFKQRGFSAREFNLSMSRNDIGNYLGLAVETVSRLFTRFQEEGLLETERKHVRILDLERLSVLAGANRTPADE
jgi:CRP/FNR family transcriptional regulator